MYACMHACMHVCMLVCMYASMYYVCMYICIYTHKHRDIRIYIYIYVTIYIYIERERDIDIACRGWSTLPMAARRNTWLVVAQASVKKHSSREEDPRKNEPSEHHSGAGWQFLPLDCIHIYIYIYIYVCVHNIYIYVYTYAKASTKRRVYFAGAGSTTRAFCELAGRARMIAHGGGKTLHTRY